MLEGEKYQGAEGERKREREQTRGAKKPASELPRRVHACKCVHRAYEEGKRAKRAVGLIVRTEAGRAIEEEVT